METDELLQLCASEELEVTFEHFGVVDIRHGRVANISCGKGVTLLEACRSFILHNPHSVSKEFKAVIAEEELPPCAHSVGYYYGAEEGHPKKCYSCGDLME